MSISCLQDSVQTVTQFFSYAPEVFFISEKNFLLETFSSQTHIGPCEFVSPSCDTFRLASTILNATIFC